MIITNKNFNLIFEENDLLHDFSYKNNCNEITLENENMVMPQFYFYKLGNNFIFTNNLNKILDKYPGLPNIIKNHGFINIANEKNRDFQNFSKNHIVKRALYQDLDKLPYKVINNWKGIKIKKTGELKVRNFNFDKLYSVPIEDSYNLIKLWREKYLDLINDWCKKKKFMPILTGGCDTRILSYFWRNHKELEFYYLREKKSGDQNALKGKREIELSKQILKSLNLNLRRTEARGKDIIVIDGQYTEPTQYYYLLNNKKFITDTINRCNGSIKRNILPFCDNYYLMIKPEKILQLRVLFMLLFCPDLLNIPLWSDSNYPEYNFSDFGNLIYECKELIKRWK